MKTDKFKNKYRIASARLRNWDYGWAGAYFVTICTKNRVCFFGDVVNGDMKLWPIGVVAKNEWLKTFEMRPDMNLQMGEYVVMPNHFHAIIIIGRNEYNMRRNRPPEPQNKFGVQSKNLASVIRGFKIGVTRNARRINPDFAWQSRFHDHIIRDEKSYNNIARYILDNPAKWENDVFNPCKTPQK